MSWILRVFLALMSRPDGLRVMKSEIGFQKSETRRPQAMRPDYRQLP
jgi:hypothetical protein